ncbi:MAG: methylenetetrahydrofolate reductase [Candidatus Omnitrophica bacterium]|nr:methylenetetrahydrofolate reductase [Candidatus Omnitrophota bacterium]
MARISIELVPRSKDYLIEELKIIKDNFLSVTVINIPDLTRYQIRSWEGCVIAKNFFTDTIPHIRAIDINSDDRFIYLKNYLEKYNIKEVLVVSGDNPNESNRINNHSPSIELIKKFKKYLPNIKVYAAFDPYRQSLKKEYDYLQKKLEIGVNGFFTQPFFDIKLIEIFTPWFKETQVFWGISPVTSQWAKDYWETKNNVIFPDDFSPNLEWSRNFAIEAIKFIKNKNNQNIYFMPIKTNTFEYLKGII